MNHEESSIHRTHVAFAGDVVSWELTQSGDSSYLLKFHGEIDLGSFDDAKRALERVMKLPPPFSVMIDVSDLSFMDTSGVHLLNQASRALAESGCSLLIRLPERGFPRILMRELGDQLGLSKLVVTEGA